MREAIAIYINLINAAVDDPKTAPVYEVLGDVMREQNDVPRALESYRRAVKLNPTVENRQKYDEMIDLSHGKVPTPAASPGSSLAAGVQKSFAGVQKSLAGVKKSLAGTPQPDTEQQQPGEEQSLADVQLAAIDVQQPTTGVQQPTTSTQQPIMGMQLPLTQVDTEIPKTLLLPIDNLPYTGPAFDEIADTSAAFNLPLGLRSDVPGRDRAFILLGIALVTLITSVLLTAQPWHHTPGPTPYKKPLSLSRIEILPLPPALGSASASGFSLLSQKPITVGTPAKVNK